MRSIPIGIPLPRANTARRRIKPQTSGFARRTAVKIKLRLARSAGMGVGGTATRGATGLMHKSVAKVHGGLKAVGSTAGTGLKAVGRGAVAIGRPIYKGCVAVSGAASAVAGWASDLLIQHQKRQRSRLAPMLLLFAFTVMLFSAGFIGLGLEVKMDGVSLGFVQSRDVITQLVRDVEERAAKYTGAPCVISPSITFNLRFLERDNMLDVPALKNTLFATVSGTAQSSWVLRVDGQIIGGSASKTSIENMLNRVMKVQSFSEEPMKTEFVQQVAIEPIGTLEEGMAGIAEMEALLTSNSMEVQTYSVQTGDTVSAVAKRHEMSVAEIKMLNPSLNVDRISIGQEIQISAAVPFLSLRQMRTEAYEEDIPFDTIIEYSDSMYTNQSKITKAGVPGLASVVADVVYVDGAVSDRDVLEYTVLVAPEAQVKLVGTKTPPAKAATGSFRKPSNGVFTSGFGYRKSFGDYHTGVDFAGKTGTAIWASDGGTVTWAGTKSTGGYGKYVIIDHGNGYTTLYAHCSELLVKVGQKVAPGEQIAKVGNTGRSTGPHVHFEIRKNGKAVNPLNYISK